MIFLADIEIIDDEHYRIIRDDKQKNKKQKKNKKKPVKNKKVTRLANKNAGMRKFTEGEIAVVKSMVANDVKTPLKGGKGKQKTISAKKGIKYHRSI